MTDALAPLAPPPRELTPAMAAYVDRRARGRLGVGLSLLFGVGAPASLALFVRRWWLEGLDAIAIALAAGGVVLLIAGGLAQARARAKERASLRRVLTRGTLHRARVAANAHRYGIKRGGAPLREVELELEDGATVTHRTFDNAAADRLPTDSAVAVLFDAAEPDVVLLVDDVLVDT